MNLKQLFNILREDINRWDKSFLKLYFTKREYKLVLRLRLCNYLSYKKILFPLYMIERFIYHRTCVKCGCDIPSKTRIDGGFKILHTWGIVINSQAKIGKNFTIVSGSVVGKNNKGVPTIGNNVYVGTHALIIGNIKIGDNSIIGAGAIVTKNVESNSVMCNSYAKCINKQKGE